MLKALRLYIRFPCRVPDGNSTRALLEAHLRPALGGGLSAGHRLRRHAQAGANALTIVMRRLHTPVRLDEGRVSI